MPQGCKRGDSLAGSVRVGRAAGSIGMLLNNQVFLFDLATDHGDVGSHVVAHPVVAIIAQRLDERLRDPVRRLLPTCACSRTYSPCQRVLGLRSFSRVLGVKTCTVCQFCLVTCNICVCVCVCVCCVCCVLSCAAPSLMSWDQRTGS